MVSAGGGTDMFQPCWTKYHPLEGAGGSVDPLRSLGISQRLGEMVFPGTSGRIWRIQGAQEGGGSGPISLNIGGPIRAIRNTQP